MAIMVTSWAEFVAAVGTSGAEVVLPENAVWDMSEISPTFAQDLTFSCSTVDGRGTEIKNLHITGRIIISHTAISNLAITNILGDWTGSGTSGQKAFFLCSNAPQLIGCTFSGVFGTGYDAMLYMSNASSSNMVRMERCAMNMIFNGGITVAGGGLDLYACRLVITLGAATGIVRVPKSEYCEFVVNAPTATAFNALGPSCTLRGNLQNCTMVYGTTKNAAAGVFSTASAPNASPPSDTGYKIFGVSDTVDNNQMKDAAYLQSLGFLIGDD